MHVIVWTNHIYIYVYICMHTLRSCNIAMFPREEGLLLLVLYACSNNICGSGSMSGPEGISAIMSVSAGCVIRTKALLLLVLITH